jgi:hypothetical protein
VPTNLYEKAIDLVRLREEFEPFLLADVDPRNRLRNVFPRFRFLGLNLFFRIMPGKAYLLDVKSENIEWSQTGIPYPKLAHYAQGLIDTMDGVDLTDLIDGMNLSVEWGEENLDLEGTVSTEWAIWEASVIAGGVPPPGNIRGYVPDPPTRRKVWSKLLDPDARRRRMWPKYPQDTYETRFRLKGLRDPRTYKRDWI